MADAEVLRVQVRLSAELHPELFAALAGARPRGRADRSRQLALLGLTGRRPADAGAPAVVGNGEQTSLDPKRARLLGALTLAD